MDSGDILILRELARRVRDAAHTPKMDEKRRRWTAHNDLRTLQPMVLFEAVSITHELFPESTLKCTDPAARAAERALKLRLFHADVIRDDQVVDAEYRVNFHVTQRGWRDRAASRVAEAGNPGLHGYVPVPVLDNPQDIYELEHSVFSVDRAATLRELAFWEDIFGDILHVRLRGNYWWTLGMTWDFLRLTGMEQFLLLPYDDEDAFHAIMRFLRDEQFLFFDFLEREDLLTLNNGNDYIGSGGYGYTDELPGGDYQGRVRTKDLWGLLESQESVSMSPAMFRDFIFPYQLDVARRFGRVYYGCCEPVHNRFDTISRIENLRTVSVSPWCDMKSLSEQLDRPLNVACKPSPALIAQGYEEEALESHVREARACFGDRGVEYVMKDVHTIQGDVTRITRWIDLARRTLDE